ncbi:helix-turn-helix domain-containing protein [Streptomyces avermitilis]|uniref:helix-turn-helix domain-containing protein n=1 Tax=Streptomyces avermitilis TaxID=33903 RepID=UPI0033AE1492
MAADQENTAQSSSSRPSVGRVLQQARTDAGLTVEELSSTTRVRIPVVRAIEQNDFTHCGGGFYARAHLRLLARAVGLDPDTLVEQYDADHSGFLEAAPAAPLFEAERITRHEPLRPNWAAGLAAAVVAVFTFTGFILIGDGSRDDSRPAHSSVAEADPSKSAEPGRKPEPSDSAIAAAPADKVVVTLVADSGSSWISAHGSNGQLLYEGVLKQGDSKTFVDGGRIDLLLGNAGAIQLYVNGKKSDDAGEMGQVQRLSYTKGDRAQGEVG